MAEVGDWVNITDNETGRVSHRDPLTKAVFVEYPIGTLEVTHPPNSVLEGMLGPNASRNMGLAGAGGQNQNAVWFWHHLQPGQSIYPILQGQVVSLFPDEGVALVKYEDPESLDAAHQGSLVIQPNARNNKNTTKKVHKKIGATKIPQARERPPLYVKAKGNLNISRGIAAARPKMLRARPRANANANLLVGLLNAQGAGAASVGGRRRKITRKRKQTKIK